MNYSFPSPSVQNVSIIGQVFFLTGAVSPLALRVSLCPSTRTATGVPEVFAKGYRENMASEGKHLNCI